MKHRLVGACGSTLDRECKQPPRRLGKSSVIDLNGLRSRFSGQLAKHLHKGDECAVPPAEIASVKPHRRGARVFQNAARLIGGSHAGFAGDPIPR